MSWTITPQTKVPVDPYRSQVSLLLHGDGATITDSSPTPKTVTAVWNAQISTAVADPFGNSTRGVLAFDGVSRATLAGDSSYAMPGDFTVEMWVYQVSSFNLVTWFEFGNTNSAEQGIMMRHNQIAVGTAVSSFANPALSNNTWTHLAVARSGATVVAYKDGVSIGSAANSSTITANNGIFLGDCLHAPGRFWNGYIDDLRITKGVARYTSNFTPPTAPFPDI